MMVRCLGRRIPRERVGGVIKDGESSRDGDEGPIMQSILSK